MYICICIYIYYKTQADIYTQTYIGNEKQDTSERVFARNVPYMTASSLHDIYIYIYTYIDNVKHIYIYTACTCAWCMCMFIELICRCVCVYVCVCMYAHHAGQGRDREGLV